MRRIFSTTLVFVIMLFLLIGVVSADDSDLTIPDNHWAMKYVDFVINNNILTWDRDVICEDTPIIRKDFVLALSRIEQITQNNNVTSSFSDVPSGVYYAAAVKWASENGIVTGYPDGLFHPADPILKQDMLVMIYRYLVEYLEIELPSNDEISISSFDDYSSIRIAARPKIEALYDAGIVTGNSNNQLLPRKETPAIEAMAFLTRIHGQRHIPDNTISVYVTTPSGSLVQNAAVVFCREGALSSYDFDYMALPTDPYDDDSMWIVMTNSNSFATFNTSQYGGRYGINAMSQYTSDFSNDYVGATKFHQLLVLPTNQYDWNIVASYDNSTRLQIWPHNMYRSCKEASWAFPQWCPTALMDSGRNLGWRYGEDILEFHQGMDCGGDGESIYNTTGYDMYVEKIGTDANSPYGCYIKVFLLNTNYYIVYQHLSQINVFEKQTINKNTNTLLGKTGNTGNVDSHLHLTLTTLGDDILYSDDPTLVKKFKDPRILFK